MPIIINSKSKKMRTEDHVDISYLKNSFFSSSDFKIRLLRKFITSKKSFLLRDKHSGSVAQ